MAPAVPSPPKRKSKSKGGATGSSNGGAQKKSWWRSIVVNTLRAGSIPRHVAFIMDGNRRFARKTQVPRIRGHELGFEKLEETLEWCLDLGIEVVTVYAFSIENFKRSPEEVDGLMELAKEKFDKLIQHDEMIQRHGVCVRVLGDHTLLRADVREAMGRACELSKHNTRAVLNVCFPYTARHEIAHAVQEVARGVERGELEAEDVNEELIERCLYTRECGEADLVVRTSGEVRLSDFLLWQSSYACLSFLDVLWPEFGLTHLCGSILAYQREHDYSSLSRLRNVLDRGSSFAEENQQGGARRVGSQMERVSRFMERLPGAEDPFILAT